MGLLDRLSYKSPREIPRNWEMTSMDAALIQSKILPTPLSIKLQPENPISFPQLGAEESAHVKDTIEPETSLERLLPNDASILLPGPSKKKRYFLIRFH